MTHPEASAPAAQQPSKASVWEDFIDILYAPAQVFRRRIDGSWFIPMAVVTLAIVIITFVTYGALEPVYDAEYERTMEAVMRQNPRMTPEMAESGRGFAEFTGKFGVIVIFPVLILIVSVATWVVGKLFGSQQTFHSALVVAGYAQIARLVGALANGVQALVMDVSTITNLQELAIGPARFVSMESTSPVLYAFLTRLDVFTIWATVLLGIGIYVTGRISKASAAMTATVVWLIGSLPMVRNMMMQQ